MTIRQMSGAKMRDAASLTFDYNKMLDDILEESQLGEFSKLYLSRPPDGRTSYLSYEDEGVFHKRSIPVKRYDLKQRTIDCHGCARLITIYQEKPVDAALIVGMFKAALRAEPGDSIVLVSGDGDFLEATREILDPNGGYGVPVQVYGFHDSTNRDFKTSQDFNFQPLDKYLRDKRTTRVVRRHATEKAWPRTKM